MCVTPSPSRSGPTTSLWDPQTSRRPTTRTHSSGSMPACARSIWGHRISPIESPTRNGWSATESRARSFSSADRELLSNTLSRLRAAISGRGSGDQLLHGEPHPGNLLNTRRGPLFVDLETCCRGPVEFDIAHAPEEVGEHYPGADQELIDQCRILMRRWSRRGAGARDDQLPDGPHWRIEGLNQLRAALDRYGLDVSGVRGCPWVPGLDVERQYDDRRIVTSRALARQADTTARNRAYVPLCDESASACSIRRRSAR